MRKTLIFLQGKGCEEVAEYIKECIVCGEKYTTNRTTQKCCSDPCRYKHQQKLIKEIYRPRRKGYQGPVEKICVICGQTFKTTRPMKKTCSQECSCENEKEVKRRANERKREEAKKKPPEKKSRKKKKEISDLARINQEAREHGMSYGKYVPIYENGGK